MANGLHEKNLAQSETLCTWRSSLRGNWEISSMPGLVCRAGSGRLEHSMAYRVDIGRQRSGLQDRADAICWPRALRTVQTAEKSLLFARRVTLGSAIIRFIEIIVRCRP